MTAPLPPVIVSGLPRSGTSWLAAGLSHARGYTYYREPDNVDPAMAETLRNTYAPADRASETVDRALQGFTRGVPRTHLVMRDAQGPLLGRLPARVANPLGNRLPALYLPKRGVLAKLVFCNLVLERMQTLEPRLKQVHIVRHPCATFESWARQGWAPGLKSLLADERLVADHLRPYVDVISGASTFWERAAVRWSVTTLVVSTQAPRHGWRLLQYEWLCESPVDNFRAAYEALGLEWTRAAERFLTESNREGDDSPYSLRRKASTAASAWRSRVDPADVDAARRIVERFDLPWYPGFDSPPAAPDWV